MKKNAASGNAAILSHKMARSWKKPPLNCLYILPDKMADCQIMCRADEKHQGMNKSEA